jgi:hypothetical protein
MLESTLKWLILIMALLIPAFLMLHFWMHRLRTQQQTRWEQELRRGFPRASKKRRARGASSEISKILERVVKSVEKAAKTGKRIARVRMKKNFELRAVTSDVIAMKMSKTTRYRSFERIRIDKIKKIKQGYEIRLRGT